MQGPDQGMGRRTEQGTTWLKSRFKWPRSRCGPRLDGRPPDANAPAAQLPGRSLSGVAGSHHARAAFFALRQCRCFFFLPRCRLWQDVAAAAQAQALLERDPAAQPELPVGAAPSQVLVEAGATGMNRGATP